MQVVNGRQTSGLIRTTSDTQEVPALAASASPGLGGVCLSTVHGSAVECVRYAAHHGTRQEWHQAPAARRVVTTDRAPNAPAHPTQPENPPMSSGTHSRASSMPRIPRAVRQARRWVRETLSGWGLDQVAEPGAQIACELATNALTHAQDDAPIVVLLMYAAGTVRIEVRDEDALHLPTLKNPAADDEEGRGLLIVDALSQRWGFRAADVGKAVWAEIDLSHREHAQDAGSLADSREGGA